MNAALGSGVDWRTMRPPLTIGSLFSGIGGLDLGVEHATGARTVFQIEKEPFCRDVLAKHWLDAVRYDDVCAAGGAPYRDVLPYVDALVGGSPCQDVSVAGLRAGFSGERSSLWREYQRIVAHVRPRFVFLENVPGLASSQGGWDFGEVLSGLALLGYDATWDRFRASDVEAPHRRERIFLLGWLADADGRGGQGADSRSERAGRFGSVGNSADVALADSRGRGADGFVGVGRAVGLGRGDPRDTAAVANAGARSVADASGVVSAWDVAGRGGRGRPEATIGDGGGSAGDVAHSGPLRQLQGSECHIGRWSGDSGRPMGHAHGERREELDGPPSQCDRNSEDVATQAGATKAAPLSPDWTETLMGFPVGWTRIAGPLGVVKCSDPANHRAPRRASRSGLPG